MGYERVHPLLVRAQESLSASGRQSNRRTNANEIPAPDHPGVDCSDHHRIRDERPETLDQIERQRRTAKAGLMKEADERVEAHAVTDDCQVFCQQAVGKREQRVDRISWRSTVAMGELERKWRRLVA